MLFRILKIFFIFLLTSIFTLFFIELNNFKKNILSLTKYNNIESTNIVILTGGANRIKDGLKIIEDFKNLKNINYKILVSGTGMGFTKSSLKKKLGPNFNSQLIQCCIDLDGVSKNTLTNASETFKWTRRNDIKEFILITSNYHMPRAILEFKNVMPNLKIYTYAITPKKHDIKNWLSSYQTFSLVFTEYCKFIIAGLRIKFFST
jgi:uncharacterized SAM-binding protein YcdF (DUF218 family)